MIPFHNRVKIFQHLSQRDRLNADELFFFPEVRNTYRDLPSNSYSIRRTHLYEDAFEKFGLEDAPSIRNPVRASRRLFFCSGTVFHNV